MNQTRSPDIDICQDKITYWFDVNGQEFGLKTQAGIETVVNSNGQDLIVNSLAFIDELRTARAKVQAA